MVQHNNNSSEPNEPSEAEALQKLVDAQFKAAAPAPAPAPAPARAPEAELGKDSTRASSPPRTPTRRSGRHRKEKGRGKGKEGEGAVSSEEEKEGKEKEKRKHKGKHGEGEEASDGDEDNEEDEEEDSDDDDDDDDGDDDEEDEEDEEPLLKYTTLTKNQGGLYRNGDAASTFMVAGDKMIVGTHNGLVHVFALPSFQSLRIYRAHSASVTAISISPYPPPLPSTKPKAGSDQQNGAPASPKVKPEAGKPGQQGKAPVPNTPSNNIYIATSSIDGHVVIQSLIDSRDVIRRNFGRPVHTVAVSPDYKNDRTYLSGGTAGNLIRTVGGTLGKTSTSTTVGGASATAQGWLGSVGLGSDEGKDTVLHSGEGKVNTVKWSLSGKYVVWVNEQGIKLMRSHMHLDSAADSDITWKRMSHIDRPNREGWEEMAGVWKARAEWVDEDGLESDAEVGAAAEASEEAEDHAGNIDAHKKSKVDKDRVERLLIGWGGSIWIMDVYPGKTDPRASTAARLGKVEVVTILRTDCIISGLSLYTPNLLLVLAYIKPDETEKKPKPKASPGTPSGGKRRKQNSLPPEMRIIDIRTKEEVSIADTLSVSRFDTLTSADYHLDTLPVIRQSTKVTSSRGALEMMGELGSNIYGGIWDVAMYPRNLLSSGASIISTDREGEKAQSKLASSLTPRKLASEVPLNPALLTRGIKIFVHSPYDCVLATKPTITDHFHWLENHEEYEAAWNLLEERPEAAGGPLDDLDSTSLPGTPTKTSGTLQDFFNDDSSMSTTAAAGPGFYSHCAKEKRRIGEKWIGQLIEAGDWDKAAQTAGKVLDTVKSWDIWYWRFAKADRFAEIVPQIPSGRLPHQALLSATIYEHALGHFIAVDPPRFAEMLDKWSTDLFDPSIVIKAIEARLRNGDIRENSIEDEQKGFYWRILYDGLAKLYLAAGRYRDALRAYIRLQDADTALTLIKTQHLAHAVSDDIPSLILLRVSTEQLKNASNEELEEASADIIHLLVGEAYQGNIPTSTVISQLKPRKDLQPFLFFYFRDLWIGIDTNTSEPLAPVPTNDDPSANILTATFTSSPKATKFAPTAARSAARELDESRAFVNDAADTALLLFATYSRPIFASFLRISNSYTLSAASQLCEEHDYIPELVYLLAKEGQARRALHLILDRLGDVAQAMAFAREQADPELWEDLVEYSLNRPEFVKVLLEEAGSAGSSAGGLDGSGLDPVALVRRIPDGMEIEGLKEALGRMLREFELRSSISEGVLRVCRGEVGASMTGLRKGQKRGIRFDIQTFDGRPSSRGSVKSVKEYGTKVSAKATKVSIAASKRKKKKHRQRPEMVRPGHCAACGEILFDDEPKSLISFPCSHIFHLPCMILYESMPPAQEDEKADARDHRPGTADSKKANGTTKADTLQDARRLVKEEEHENDNETDGDDDGEGDSDPEAELGLPQPDPENILGSGSGSGSGSTGMGTGTGSEGIRGVGAKVRYAKIIRGRVAGGCPLTVHAVA